MGSEPELAAYLLCKLFYLGGELTPTLDSELATLTVERRVRRRDAAATPGDP